MKRKIALLVSMIQLLCFVLPIGQVSADYKSQLTTEIANAYYNKACEFLKERYSGSRFSIAFYVYDIDKDEIPELIALDTVALGSMNYYFYTYSNGEVKDCGSLLTRYFEWPRTYNDGNGIVLYYVRGGDLSTAALCTLESGKISVVRNYSVDESVSSFEFGMNDLKTVVDIEFDIINNIPKRNLEEADYNAIFTAVNELVYVPEEAVVEATAINVLLNGKAIEFDQPPIIVDDRTLVPLRAIFEALGATVDWNGNTQTVTATRDNTVIKITIGDNKLYVNDKVTVLDVPAQIVNDRTLVPVRAVSEAFGCNVDWNGETKTVMITTPYIPVVFTASDEKIGNATVDLKTGFDFVKTDSSQKNLKLALTAVTLSSQIYTNAKGMHTDAILNGLGYDSVMVTQGGISAYERPVSCFAYKHLNDGSNVFAVVVRGTDSAQGSEDILTDVGDGIFTMFEDSAEAVRDELERFMCQVTRKSSAELKQEKNYFFFTGHSLGGAVANCLSVDNVIKEYASNEKGRIYTYTFESPHTCVNLWWTNPESESNAYNFKVNGDTVTNMPFYIGSTTYGKDEWIQVSELDDSVFNNLFTNSQFTKMDGNVGLHDTCLGLIYIVQFLKMQ